MVSVGEYQYPFKHLQQYYHRQYFEGAKVQNILEPQSCRCEKFDVCYCKCDDSQCSLEDAEQCDVCGIQVERGVVGQ